MRAAEALAYSSPSGPGRNHAQQVISSTHATQRELSVLQQIKDLEEEEFDPCEVDPLYDRARDDIGSSASRYYQGSEEEEMLYSSGGGVGSSEVFSRMGGSRRPDEDFPRKLTQQQLSNLSLHEAIEKSPVLKEATNNSHIAGSSGSGRSGGNIAYHTPRQKQQQKQAAGG